MIKFSYTILYVADVLKSIEFYEKSFGFVRKFISPENDYGELETGQTVLSFGSKELASSNFKEGFLESSVSQKPFSMELAFATDNVSEVVSLAIKHGAKLLSDPQEKPWGQTVAYIRDIDGYLLEICTPIT